MDKSIKKILIYGIVVLFILAFLLGLITRALGVYGSVTSGIVYYVCLITIVIYTVKVIEHQSLESIGFDFKNIIKNVVLGIGIFALLTAVFYSYYFIVYGIEPKFVHLSLFQTLLKMVYFICFVGFTEELIFRGYLLDRLKEILNSKIYAVLLSSVIFALWHFPTSYYFGQVIFAFFFGIILSTIRVKTKGNIILALAIGHGLYNSCMYLAGYFIK